MATHSGHGGQNTHQMRVLQLLHDRNVIQLNVEVLVYALERSFELDVVFELHRDFMVNEGFEETAPSG